jgi:hypothetical protein
MNFTPEVRTKDHAASFRPFTSKVCFRSRSVRVRFVAGRSGAEAGFFSSNFRLPLSLAFCEPIFRSHLILIGVLPGGTSGRSLSTFKQNCSVGCRGTPDSQAFSHCFLSLQTANRDVSALRVGRNGIDFEYRFGSGRSLLQNCILPA